MNSCLETLHLVKQPTNVNSTQLKCLLSLAEQFHFKYFLQQAAILINSEDQISEQNTL